MEIYQKILISFGMMLIMIFAFFYGMTIVYKNTPMAISPSMYMSCSGDTYAYCSCNWNGELPDLVIMQECVKFIKEMKG